jgi:hypothetical protein
MPRATGGTLTPTATRDRCWSQLLCGCGCDHTCCCCCCHTQGSAADLIKLAMVKWDAWCADHQQQQQQREEKEGELEWAASDDDVEAGAAARGSSSGGCGARLIAQIHGASVFVSLTHPVGSTVLSVQPPDCSPRREHDTTPHSPPCVASPSRRRAAL